MYQDQSGVRSPWAFWNMLSSAPSNNSAGAAYRSDETSVRKPARTTRSVMDMTSRLIRDRPNGRPSAGRYGSGSIGTRPKE